MTTQPHALSGIKAVAFDAYGTLFDVHAPAAQLAEEIGPTASAISEMWRQKQLQYTWLRSLMGAYADFWQVTQDALDYAMEAHGVADADLRERLLSLYRDLDAYPDAAPLLSQLRERGIATAILSNGDPGMLHAATTHAGLVRYLDHVHFGLSVCHLNRFSQPSEHLPAKPLAVINGLSELPELLAAST